MIHLRPGPCQSKTTPVSLFFGHEENHQITPAAQGGAPDSARLLLTKNPDRSLCCPGCQVRGDTRVTLIAFMYPESRKPFQMLPRPQETVALVEPAYMRLRRVRGILDSIDMGLILIRVTSYPQLTTSRPAATVVKPKFNILIITR